MTPVRTKPEKKLQAAMQEKVAVEAWLHVGDEVCRPINRLTDSRRIEVLLRDQLWCLLRREVPQDDAVWVLG